MYSQKDETINRTSFLKGITKHVCAKKNGLSVFGYLHMNFIILKM